MDSITTTPIPVSDIPINQSNNRAMSHRLSARFPSSKDATYPDDIVNEFGQSPLSGSRRGMDPGTRSRTLNRNSSKAQRGSASGRFDPSMSMRRSGTTSDGESGRIECESEDEDEEDEEDEKESGEEGEETKGDEEPVRMSLMALLAESEGSSYMMGEGEDEDEDEDDGGGDIGGELNNCCVCQVRHKGAAFVPCGHSFCRLCSRELWVEGANCPLCNNFILEILDIF